MPEISRTAQEMVSGMTPTVRSGEFVFVTVADPALAASLSSEAISFFKEDEGMSLIIPVETARGASLSVDQPMRCITLNVYSSLDGVGLTSAVSTALGDNAIPCNMVAAFHHDHLFVPTKMHDRALQILTVLQDQAARDA
ncbi:ACT domain-containing protein [Sulfitobacter sabulilitoris]|uniref:ACT domain-containing protein n=2 Tax=Sulfitobacter sabulilitoris TaxID=2562655 RepID=A0A5S3PMK9_9RHOB|nr:ACT domain-containing protein [Sulfitobacter sabulilitoris]TMM55623.1 ACT domain-containing protein [Sulfitobacter sabulilitoris]